MRTRWLLAIAIGIGIASMLGCVRGDRTAPAHSASFSLVERVEEAETSFDETFFRSVRKDGRLVNAVTMEGRTELSLTPPLPSRLRYRLRVPDAPILRFATGCGHPGRRDTRRPPRAKDRGRNYFPFLDGRNV